MKTYALYELVVFVIETTHSATSRDRQPFISIQSYMELIGQAYSLLWDKKQYFESKSWKMCTLFFCSREAVGLIWYGCCNALVAYTINQLIMYLCDICPLFSIFISCVIRENPLKGPHIIDDSYILYLTILPTVGLCYNSSF